MFGYVQVRKAELKVKDYELYHSFYCGLCHALKDGHGLKGQITLTYDCTFLVMLLSSLYELDVEESMSRCIVHPAKKHAVSVTDASRYCADMNVLLSWYHFKDDHEDEKSIKAAGGLALYRSDFLKIKDKYPYQCRGIAKAMKALAAVEKSASDDALDKGADCFGRLMMSLFAYRPGDIFEHDLNGMAYHLGRFIYIMDAWDDKEEDAQKGRYNPLKGDEDTEALLFDEMAKCSYYFEKLPCLQYGDILRNILYAGVWNVYDRKRCSTQSGAPVLSS